MSSNLQIPRANAKCKQIVNDKNSFSMLIHASSYYSSVFQVVYREMITTADEDGLIKILREEIGLTPYESRAYIAILLHGALSARGVNQKSGIPRSRTYDVLNRLVEKGLLMEKAGRPREYASIEPQVGLENMMMKLERKMRRQLEEKRKAAQRLSSSLTILHAHTRAKLFAEVLSGADRRKKRA